MISTPARPDPLWWHSAAHPIPTRVGSVLACLVVALTVAAPGCTRHRSAGPPAAPTPALATQGTTTLVLFFVGEQGLLRREQREVAELPNATPARVRLVLDELLGGSRAGLASPMPWAASVQAVFTDRQGRVFVDLSPSPEPLIAGTSAELAFVYSIVNSIAANCPGVVGVQLLVGGKEVATLGHVNLSRPLSPNLDVVEP